MLYNIRASFIGVLGVGLNAMLAITLLTEPPLVAGLMVSVVLNKPYRDKTEWISLSR